MVECSPQGGAASLAVATEQGNLPAPEHQQPSQHRSVLPKDATSTTCVKSSSDDNVGAAVSSLSDAFNVQRGSFSGVEDDKIAEKRDVVSTEMNRGNEEENDTFLNASMQLMHLNGEARQRVRQLWTSVQRLGRDNQISEAGMDLLYVELGNILKNMNAEKLEAAKPLKSGRLTLLASSPASDPGTVGGGAAVKALFGSRTTAQLMQCSLSEDQSKLEMTPVRQEVAPNPGGSRSTPQNAPASSLGRFALSSTASLMGMITDAFQEEPTTRVIRLHGCQARRLVPKSPSNEGTSLDMAGEGGLPKTAKIFHRFQLLVPYKTQMGFLSVGVRADALSPTRAPLPYESFIFEVPTPTTATEGVEELDAEAQVDEWVCALDNVCRFQLHRLEHALRDAPTIGRRPYCAARHLHALTLWCIVNNCADRYRATLERHFPVCVSLTWLRNRVDQPTLQRRASVNLSMIQIVKDLGRDKMLLDGHLFSAGDPFESNDVESDSVSEVVKYMVKKVLEFESDITPRENVPGNVRFPSHQPLSPAHRLAKNCEARALSFVERVLQGSSRTQSGGDIYDAISFFCQQEHVSICPVSQDARPVQMRILTDVSKSVFQVEIQVCMQFKVIELTPRSPTPASPNRDENFSSALDSTASDSSHDRFCEWAVLEGTLSRQFTLGQLSAPGTITINYISSISS